MCAGLLGTRNDGIELGTAPFGGGREMGNADGSVGRATGYSQNTVHSANSAHCGHLSAQPQLEDSAHVSSL